MFFKQLFVNFILFFLSIFGVVFNTKSVLITLICIELMLLSVNLNFALLSGYFDDLYGQLFSMFILVVAACESSIGLAIIISYYRVRGIIFLDQKPVLKY
jgi:NADH-quinone oxidoreductase subunit K